MAAEFTPFTQVLKARLPSVAAGHQTAHFTPVAPAPQRSGDTAIFASAKPQPHAAANIELKRDGERISQIRVQCRCGEVIEIDCEY